MSTIIGKIKKTPWDRVRKTIDYSSLFNSDETVTSVSFASTPQDGNPALVDTYSVSGQIITIFVSGGVDGTDYDIEVETISSYGRQKQNAITVNCRS